MEPSEEAAIAFKHAADEIRFFKSQQWSITNYALALQAGVVGAVKLIVPPLRCCWSDVAALVIVVLLVAAVWLLIALEAAICKERDRMADARNRLPVLKEIHKGKLAEGFRYTPFFVLLVVNIIAGVVAEFVVYHLI
jgi:hypothetical protein